MVNHTRPSYQKTYDTATRHLMKMVNEEVHPSKLHQELYPAVVALRGVQKSARRETLPVISHIKKGKNTSRRLHQALGSTFAQRSYALNHEQEKKINAQTDTVLQELVSRHIAKRGNPDAKDVHRDTLLIKATIVNSFDTAKALLDYGADPNIPGKKGMTPLMHAVSHNDNKALQMVKMLLRDGAHVDVRDDDGKTVLHHVASAADNGEIIEILIDEHGANPNVVDEKGYPPLKYTWGIQNIQALFDRGANPNMTAGKRKKTMLMFALEDTTTDSWIIAAYINHDAQVNAADLMGKTVLMYAIENFNEHSETENIEMLLEHGARIRSVDKRGRSVMDYAAGNPDVLAVLEKKKSQDITFRRH